MVQRLQALRKLRNTLLQAAGEATDAGEFVIAQQLVTTMNYVDSLAHIREEELAKAPPEGSA